MKSQELKYKSVLNLYFITLVHTEIIFMAWGFKLMKSVHLLNNIVISNIEKPGIINAMP